MSEGPRLRRLLSAFLAVAALPVLAALPVKSVPPAEPPRASPDKARGVQLKRIKFVALPGTAIGEALTADCRDGKPIYLDKKLATDLGEALNFAFQKSLRDLAYQRDPSEESVFAEAARKPLDIEMGTLLQEIQMAYCQKEGGVVEGSAYLKARWELLALQAQKVVQVVTIEGSAPAGRHASLTELERSAAQALVRNFLADPQVVAWLGGQQPLPAAVATAPRESALRLDPVAPPAGGVAKDATLLRAAVVTVEAGGSSGTGFVISRKGYVLTDQHVVKAQRFVKLRLASGRELVGEVVQQEPRRDVALIRTEAGLDPLALRLGDLAPGETVYALGSPLGEKFSGSLTRGIVSAYRNRDGLRFIQSDVSILPGSSGGPLLDDNGRVIGLTQSGVEAGRARLNLFIPVADALQALAITAAE